MWVVVLLVLVVWSDDARVVGAQNASNQFSYPSFPSEVPNILTVYDVAHDYGQRAYALNWYTNTNSDGVTPCGRMFYRHKVRLKDRATGRVASFNTAFSFSFISNSSKDVCGDGLVFTFAALPNITTSEEQLPLCSFAYEPLPSDRVFAVKFGSRRQHDGRFVWLDPSDSTIAVVVANRGTLLPDPQHNLCAGALNTTNCGYFCGNKGRFSTWVDYDAESKTLAVFFRNGSLQTGGKPQTPVITVANLALEDVLDEEMYVAITGRTRYHGSYNPDRVEHRMYAWNFKTSSRGADPPLPDSVLSGKPGAQSTKVGVLVGIFTAVLVVACFAVGLCVCFFVNRKYRNKQVAETGVPPKLPASIEPGAVAQYSAAASSSQYGPASSPSYFRGGIGSSDKMPYAEGRYN